MVLLFPTVTRSRVKKPGRSNFYAPMFDIGSASADYVEMRSKNDRVPNTEQPCRRSSATQANTTPKNARVFRSGALNVVKGGSASIRDLNNRAFFESLRGKKVDC